MHVAEACTGTSPTGLVKILALRQTLKLTQGELGEKLNTSAMAVSRWERGEAEPPAEACIRLGNLAGDPLCWFFWGEMAGLSTANVMRVLPDAERRLRRGRVATVRVVHAGAGKTTSLDPKDFVAVPVLPIHAVTRGEDASPVEITDLDQLKPEGMWAAPAGWCPNPARTISLQVKGNSMSPLILDGYIIAVDTSDVSRDDLIGQIMSWHGTPRRSDCWFHGCYDSITPMLWCQTSVKRHPS